MLASGPVPPLLENALRPLMDLLGQVRFGDIMLVNAVRYCVALGIQSFVVLLVVPSLDGVTIHRPIHQLLLDSLVCFIASTLTELVFHAVVLLLAVGPLAIS